MERIESDPRIVDVLVAFRFSCHFFGGQLETYPELPDKGLRLAGRGPTESRKLLWTSFVALLERLQKSGEKVFVLLPVPELGRDIRGQIQTGIAGSGSIVAGTTTGHFEARNRYVNAKLKSLPWSDTLIAIDPAALRRRLVLPGRGRHIDVLRRRPSERGRRPPRSRPVAAVPGSLGRSLPLSWVVSGRALGYKHPALGRLEQSAISNRR